MSDFVEQMGLTPLDDWSANRLKWLLKSLQSGQRESGNIEETEIFSIGGEHIGWKGEWLLENPRYLTSEYFSKLKNGKLCEGDVVLVKDGATIGKTAFVTTKLPGAAALNEHVFLLRANTKLEKRFLFYIIQSKFGQDQICLEIRGAAQPGLNSSFEDVFVALTPPVDQQTRIADFLDRETARIDGLIAKEERLLKLLEEKRAALISHAVTKGFQSDSDNTKWRKMPIKHACKINQLTLSENTEPEAKIEYIDIGNVDSNGNILATEVLTFEKAPSRARRIVRDGDTIVSTVRTYLKAITGISDPPPNLIVSTGFAVLTPLSLLNKDFLKYLCRSTLFIDEVISRSTGVSYPAITPITLGNISIALPSVSKQREIVEYLSPYSTRFDALKTKISEAIGLLREKRTALISAAVTGKIQISKGD